MWSHIICMRNVHVAIRATWVYVNISHITYTLPFYEKLNSSSHIFKWHGMPSSMKTMWEGTVYEGRQHVIILCAYGTYLPAVMWASQCLGCLSATLSMTVGRVGGHWAYIVDNGKLWGLFCASSTWLLSNISSPQSARRLWYETQGSNTDKGEDKSMRATSNGR